MAGLLVARRREHRGRCTKLAFAFACADGLIRRCAEEYTKKSAVGLEIFRRLKRCRVDSAANVFTND
jgi:hypothetical protein